MPNYLDIFRQGGKIATIDIDENTVFNGKLPGTELISCPISTLQVLNLQEEDYIIHRGAAYKIRILPDVDKDSQSLAKSYKINFLARFYDLHDVYVQHTGSRRFSYYGTAADHLQVLIDSANLNDTGWTIGNIDTTTVLNLDYDWTFIRPSLDQIAEAFKLEWNAVGTTINMVASFGNNTGLVFEMGRGKGLHQISRSSDTSKEKINRVYGIGGTRNIDSSYRNGEEDNLVFEERYVETAGVTAGTERVREGKYENLDLYPKFEGVISEVTFVSDAGKITSATIKDNNIDFDLMANLQEGIKPKVSFLTGPVTGIDFEISAFSLANKEVTLIPFTDTSGYYFPSATSQPEIGDKFTFIDIRMPAAYVATWEGRLRNETLAFLNQNKGQRLIYTVTPDEKFLRDNNIILNCGDRATAIDTDLGVNEILRFTEISYPLVNEFDVTGVIGNEIVFDQSVKQYAAVLNNIKQIAQITAKGIIQSKRAAQALRQLEGSIFDTDGMFDSAKLNVGVLTAALGIFGVKSQNFVLSSVRMVDNFGGDPNAINISGGQLIHLEISNAGAGGDTWTMTALSVNNLVSASLYYIYAKCSKTSQVGSWVVSTAQIKPDDVAGFYHFLAGVIYPVNGSFRDTEFTYGITDITGNRIKTGTISGRNNALSINLETGQITGDVTFTGSSLSSINSISSNANLGVTNAANALGVANTAVNNAAAVQNNLIALQNGLGGLAYKSAVELAQLGSTVVQGGYIKSVLLDVNAIIVSGNIATQTYASTVASTAGNNALSAAQLYAQSQANSAVSTANGYTDTKAIATINTAQSYADSVAITKANAAQANAISQASSTAQSYASTAQSNAVAASTALINSIQIGGVNTFGRTTSGLGAFNGLTNPQHVNGSYGGYNIKNGIYSIGTLGATNGNLRIEGVIKSYGKWTISGEMYSNSNFTCKVDVVDGVQQSIDYPTPNIWMPFSLTFDAVRWNEFPNWEWVDFSGIGYQYFLLQNLKVEKGTKATAYTPSIEDTQALITTAQNAANAANTAYNTLTANLKSLAYQDVVEAAKLGSTVITAGMLSNNLIDTNYIRTNVINAGYIESLEVVSKSIRTANSGSKRVEITQSTNNIVLYNAANNVLVEIDDDSAFERFNIQPNDPGIPPTITSVYGPGIRVGTVNDPGYYGFSSMGRTGFATDSNLTIYKKNSITKVLDINSDNETAFLNAPLQVKGLSIINSDLSITSGYTGTIEMGVSSNQQYTLRNQPLQASYPAWFRITYVNGIVTNIQSN